MIVAKEHLRISIIVCDTSGSIGFVWSGAPDQSDWYCCLRDQHSISHFERMAFDPLRGITLQNIMEINYIEGPTGALGGKSIKYAPMRSLGFPHGPLRVCVPQDLPYWGPTGNEGLHRNANWACDWLGALCTSPQFDPWASLPASQGSPAVGTHDLPPSKRNFIQFSVEDLQF